ncbi:MAG TPA: ASCH domain-containing protein [Allosphingosinicella sp.]|jgi:hypothetical protein|nr:ASCH domain-containing protein [Allosphingosinicella sp.]
MKAISLWQPWASAMALGLKRIETRHWSTKYRGLMAIHAAKRWTADERDFHAIEHEAGRMPAELPLGAVVATARLYDVKRTEQLVDRISDDEHCWGNYAPERYGWIFEDIVALPVPILFRGAQGLFDVPDAVLRGEALPEPADAPLKPPPPAARQGLLL